MATVAAGPLHALAASHLMSAEVSSTEGPSTLAWTVARKYARLEGNESLRNSGVRDHPADFGIIAVGHVGLGGQFPLGFGVL